MVLRWDASVSDSAFDASLEEATHIGRAWGPTTFDALAELGRQRPRLIELDAKRSATK